MNSSSGTIPSSVLRNPILPDTFILVLPCGKREVQACGPLVFKLGRIESYYLHSAILPDFERSCPERETAYS